MSTPKQIDASRPNGAKSKGPTPEGKLVSSRNSSRHGLFAENIVLEAEDTGRFIELVESLFEEHNPRTPTEKLLVENIAAARWRQWRIWGMQKVAFDHEVASPSTTNDPTLRAVPFQKVNRKLPVRNEPSNPLKQLPGTPDQAFPTRGLTLAQRLLPALPASPHLRSSAFICGHNLSRSSERPRWYSSVLHRNYARAGQRHLRPAHLPL